MDQLSKLQEVLGNLYNEFFAKMNIDPQSGKIRDSSKWSGSRFVSMPFIGLNYLNAPKKILFVGLDVGNDEGKDHILTFEERRESNMSAAGSSPHMSGTYITALYLLREKYADAWQRISERKELFKTLAKDQTLPDDVMDHITMVNRWKFVTANRELRHGAKDRFYRDEKLEIHLLYKEIELLNPDIVWFQGDPKGAATYEFLDTLKEQGRVIYLANHPSRAFPIEINGEKIDCRKVEYLKKLLPR